MSAIDDVLASVDLNQIATALGEDPQDVRQAAETAAGSLLQGAENSTGSEQSAVAFANALGQHVASPATSGNLDVLDLNDGAKIANHLVDADQQRQLFNGKQGDLVSKLLPILAPIVMGYLASKIQANGGIGGVLGQVLGGGQSSQQNAPAQQQDSSMGGLGDVLGQILGGSQSGSPSTTAPASVPEGGGLGDILGQILGGGAQSGTTAPTMPSAAAPAAPAANGGMADPGLPGQSNGGSQPSNDRSQASVGSILSNILFGK